MVAHLPNRRITEQQVHAPSEASMVSLPDPRVISFGRVNRMHGTLIIVDKAA
jgi:hypothetical protein